MYGRLIVLEQGSQKRILAQTKSSFSRISEWGEPVSPLHAGIQGPVETLLVLRCRISKDPLEGCHSRARSLGEFGGSGLEEDLSLLLILLTRTQRNKGYWAVQTALCSRKKREWDCGSSWQPPAPALWRGSETHTEGQLLLSEDRLGLGGPWTFGRLGN